MFLTPAPRTALLASLLLLPLGLGGVAATAKAGTDDAQSTDSSSQRPPRISEQEKPEAGGRVIKRTKEADRQGPAAQQASAVSCPPEAKGADSC